jgi:hypothetical protein
MDLEQRIKNVFLRYGIMLGLILLALSILSYYLITRATTSPVLFVAIPIFFSLFIPIVLTVFFCFNGRRKLGGYLTFKQATTGIFIMFLIAYIIQFIGKDIVFNKFIEPNNIVNTQNAAIKAKTALMKQRLDAQKVIGNSINEMKKDFAIQQKTTIGSTIQGIIFSILFIFLFALVFGSLFKKVPPEFDGKNF